MAQLRILKMGRAGTDHQQFLRAADFLFESDYFLLPSSKLFLILPVYQQKEEQTRICNAGLHQQNVAIVIFCHSENIHKLYVNNKFSMQYA